MKDSIDKIKKYIEWQKMATREEVSEFLENVKDPQTRKVFLSCAGQCFMEGASTMVVAGINNDKEFLRIINDYYISKLREEIGIEASDEFLSEINKKIDKEKK